MKRNGKNDKDIKAVLFDVDGTLSEGNFWDRLNRTLGVPEDLDRRLHAAYYKMGGFSYQEWLNKLLAIYNQNGPVHRRTIDKVLSQFTLLPGAADVCAMLQARGYQLGIISGGLEPAVYAVSRAVGVHPDFAFANCSVAFDIFDYLDRIHARGNDEFVKVTDLRRLCAEWGLRPEQCAFVGDGWSDREVFKATGNGITFKDNRCSMLHVLDSCWKQVDGLENILEFLP